MTKLKPKKITVTYIASEKQPKQADDAEAIKKALQQKSEETGEDCPFC